ncbi:MAG TPA: hypothetical protein DHW02_08025, partial [Ktedonobacter sp.]|nr:hypothetical protein [Ktedonobacter sp.]
DILSMATDILSPLGPLFGPDFITIVVNDETNTQYHLEVYPDANNDVLKANGLQTHFYFQPQRVYLAKKQNSPTDYDFGMTVFKGLLTEESNIGVTTTTGGDAEAGGGFCSFSTTFAIPDSVIANAIQALRNQEYGTPPPRIAQLLGVGKNDPTPELGIVTIIENDVTIEVPPLASAGNANVPFFINAQGAGKGSIEAGGISSFLVTCNQNAAGAIVGSLQGGVSPFTVHYNLKQSFYINACQIHIIANVDKIFDQFSAAVSAGGFLGIDSATLSANYQNCVTSGAIQTIMRMNNAEIPDDLKKMIMDQCEQMRQSVFDLVKKEIFDWTPTPDPPATTDRGFFSSLFGGASVSLKANYQRHSVN